MPGIDRGEHAAPAIFGRVLDEVAKDLVEILPLDRDGGAAIAVDVEAGFGIEPLDRAPHRLGAFADRRVRVPDRPPPHRARAGEVVVDMAADCPGFADHGVGQIG